MASGQITLTPRVLWLVIPRVGLCASTGKTRKGRIVSARLANKREFLTALVIIFIIILMLWFLRPVLPVPSRRTAQLSVAGGLGLYLLQRNFGAERTK